MIRISSCISELLLLIGVTLLWMALERFHSTK